MTGTTGPLPWVGPYRGLAAPLACFLGFRCCCRCLRLSSSERTWGSQVPVTTLVPPSHPGYPPGIPSHPEYPRGTPVTLAGTTLQPGRYRLFPEYHQDRPAKAPTKPVQGLGATGCYLWASNTWRPSTGLLEALASILPPSETKPPKVPPGGAGMGGINL